MEKVNQSTVKSLNIGTAHAKAGRLGSAEAALKKAVQENPSCTEAHFNLAVVFAESGKIDDSIKTFQKVVDLSPDMHSVHKTLGETLLDYEIEYFDANTEFDDINPLKSAISLYRQTIDAIPILKECQRNIGQALMARGQYSEADAAFERATKIPDDLQEVFHNVGATIHCPGNLENAVAMHRAAMANAPDYSEEEISEQSYLSSELTFTDNEILLPDGFEVMMEWERPIMERSAEIITTIGGDILNVGFGMAIIDTAIQQYNISTHTIIEAHPQVVHKAEVWAHNKKNVRIVAKRWQDAINEVGPFDGIYFDTLMPPMIPFLKEAPNLLKQGGVFTFFQMMLQFENIEAMADTGLSFALERMAFKVIDKNRYYRLTEIDESGHYSAPLLVYRKT